MDRLPPELITQIVASLPRLDILVVRQTSRHIECSSFAHFAHLFFRKRGFMITTESLNVLASISRHHGLRKHVQHVWFNPDCFTFVNNPFWTLDSDDEEPTATYEDQARRAKLFDKYVHDHWDLLYTARLQELLTEVFKCLPMLRTVGMRRGTYRPYGWQTVTNNVGLDPRVLGGEVSLYTTAFADPTYLFIAVIKALAVSGRRIRRLYTDAIQIDHVDQSLIPSVADCRQALGSVQYVEINATGLPEARDVIDPTVLSANKTASNLETLLGSMHELLEIGMTIFRDPKQRHMIPPEPRRLQSWTEAYPYKAFISISNNLELRHLRRVKLEKLCTTVDALCTFLQPCSPALMSLKLRHIQFLHMDENTDTSPRAAWQAMVSFLRNECSALEYLLLHDLSCNESSVLFTQTTLHGTHAGHNSSYTDYENLNLELLGHECIVSELKTSPGDLAERSRAFSYTMDDAVWYTDTSDEEW